VQLKLIKQGMAIKEIFEILLGIGSVEIGTFLIVIKNDYPAMTLLTNYKPAMSYGISYGLNVSFPVHLAAPCASFHFRFNGTDLGNVIAFSKIEIN
jgi:hypothetical protein